MYKKIYFLFASFLIILVLYGASCKKMKTGNPIDQLPPETQTGARTFGCLVDGKVFKPKGNPLAGSPLQCYYQHLDIFNNDDYHFVLKGVSNTSAGVFGVSLFADSVKLSENRKYPLKQRAKGNLSAEYFKSVTVPAYELFPTDGNIYTGELWIKKLDTINQVISGTFWFDGVNASGQKVEVREGRFDMQFTR